MSKEQIEKFLEKINLSVELQDELKSAPTAAAVANIAKNLGLDVTAGDVLRIQATATAKLSDSELENISGGTVVPHIKAGLFFLGLWGASTVAVGGTAYGINELSKD